MAKPVQPAFDFRVAAAFTDAVADVLALAFREVEKAGLEMFEDSDSGRLYDMKDSVYALDLLCISNLKSALAQCARACERAREKLPVLPTVPEQAAALEGIEEELVGYVKRLSEFLHREQDGTMMLRTFLTAWGSEQNDKGNAWAPLKFDEVASGVIADGMTDIKRALWMGQQAGPGTHRIVTHRGWFASHANQVVVGTIVALLAILPTVWVNTYYDRQEKIADERRKLALDLHDRAIRFKGILSQDQRTPVRLSVSQHNAVVKAAADSLRYFIDLRASMVRRLFPINATATVLRFRGVLDGLAKCTPVPDVVGSRLHYSSVKCTQTDVDSIALIEFIRIAQRLSE